MPTPSGKEPNIKKPFNYNFKQMLNGIDTLSFDHVVATVGDINTYMEGATHLLIINQTARMFGRVKSKEVKQAQKIENIIIESVISKLRDTETSSSLALALSPAKDMLNCILPAVVDKDGVAIPKFKIIYNATVNPMIKYAFRSGSILTHLNTICAMSGLNWRYQCEPATVGVDDIDRSVIVVTDGKVDEIPDRPLWVENKDIFRLSLDTSLYKKYTQVNAIGVEKEISGYICTASFHSPTYLILDCDDGALGEEEIIPASDPHGFLTNVVNLDRIWIQDMLYTGGWETNDTFLVDDEFIKYSNVYYDAGNGENQGVKGITREQWFSVGNTPHVYGTDCLITQGMLITPADPSKPITISPATNLFKIGTEVVRVTSYDATHLHLATVDPVTRTIIGRGQYGTPAYAHRRGAIVQPYYIPASLYPASMFQTATQMLKDETLQITIHGKGITSKDGIDKLAWGVLLNLQNGILSGKCTYKSSDFFTSDIQVGKLVTIQPATRKLETATTYDVMIYSVSRKQNQLMEIEFGNVAPEVLHMLKSGDYALQAAIRKDDAMSAKDVQTISLGGALAVSSTPAGYQKYRVGGW